MDGHPPIVRSKIAQIDVEGSKDAEGGAGLAPVPRLAACAADLWPKRIIAVEEWSKRHDEAPGRQVKKETGRFASHQAPTPDQGGTRARN